MLENSNNTKIKEKITKSSLKMSIVTAISRIFGLVRDQIQAALLGTTFIADAFAIGFILPNLLRRLFAEGNMIASFIPVFTELEKEKGIEESKKFFRAIFTLLTLILILIVLIGIIISPLLVKFLYKSADKEALDLATNIYIVSGFDARNFKYKRILFYFGCESDYFKYYYNNDSFNFLFLFSKCF